MMLTATSLAFTLAMVGALARGIVGSIAAGAAIGIIIAIPLLRVAVLGWHWWRSGDRRYSAVAGGVVAIVVAGALLAML